MEMCANTKACFLSLKFLFIIKDDNNMPFKAFLT